MHAKYANILELGKDRYKVLKATIHSKVKPFFFAQPSLCYTLLRPQLSA